MPIVIDEVAVTVEVDNRQGGGAAQQASVLEERQQLIEECVDKVLEILEQRDER